MKEKIIPEKPETIDKLHAGNLICCLNLREKKIENKSSMWNLCLY